MSLKLDELRKRLLQNQSPEATDSIHFPSSGAAISREITAGEPDPVRVRQNDAVIIKSPARVDAAESRSAERRLARLELAAAGGTESEPATPEKAADEAPILPLRRNTVAPKPEPAAQLQLADAVAKVFEQTKTLQVRFDDLARSISKLERIGDDAKRVFEPLRSFHEQLAQLAASFEPMRAFQAHLAQLSDNFAPMKVLHDQLDQLADSFQQHLAQLVKVLDPARDFRDRILTLAHSFDEAVNLQSDFSELYSSFRTSASEAAEPETKGLEPPADASR